MAEVKSFNVNNLPNDNHLPFNMMVRDYARENQAVSTQMSAILTPYEAAIQAEDDAMHKPQGSALTPDIEQTDKDRDTVYYIIDHLIDVYLHYPDGQEKTDAVTIDKYLKTNKVNTSSQYDRETGQILNLIQDLEANCVAEMQRLGLTDKVAQLKQLNQRMFDLLQQRDQQNAEKILAAVRLARRKTDDLYHRLVWAVNAFAFVNAEPYLTFIRSTNQTIDRLNLQVFKITGSSADKNEVDSPEGGEGGNGSTGSGGTGGGSGEGGESGTPGTPSTPSTPTWPEIDPDSEREFTATFLNSEDMEEIEVVHARYGTPLTPPQAPEGTIWPRNLPTTMPYGDFVTRNIPADSPTEPLYKLEYKDGDEVLRTDMLPVNSIIIRYPLPDDKIWTHFPHRGLTPAQDWAVVAGEE